MMWPKRYRPWMIGNDTADCDSNTDDASVNLDARRSTKRMDSWVEQQIYSSCC